MYRALFVATLAVAGIADPLAAPAGPPLLKVTYGEKWGPAPFMYSYSVWATGHVRYEPSRLEHNGVKVREDKSFRTTPEKAVAAVNHLLENGFLALKPEVQQMAVRKAEDGEVLLNRVVITHAQALTLEFYLQQEQFRTVLDRHDIFPWVLPALKKIESELGITELVQ